MSTLYLEKKTDLNCFSRKRGDNIFLIQRYYYPKKTIKTIPLNMTYHTSTNRIVK